MGVFDEKYWLPRNTTWESMPTQAADLIYPVYFMPVILIARILWESLVGVPIGWYLGYYGDASLPGLVCHHMFGGFAANTRSKRVLECFTRFSYYSAAFIYGAIVMYNKSWLWDVRQAWIGYPYHTVDPEIWWYYMVEMSFYYMLLATAVFDVRRTDFWELIFHHAVTIGLLSLSFTINFVRVGTLVLFSHDLADISLEGGKLFRYDSTKKTETTVVFVIFLISWIATRLGYFPFVVIRSALFEAASLIQPDYDVFSLTQIPYAPRVIILMLCSLVVLHIFWTVIIVRIVYITLTEGEVVDVRSDDEEGELAEKERVKKLKKKMPRKDD